MCEHENFLLEAGSFFPVREATLETLCLRMDILFHMLETEQFNFFGVPRYYKLSLLRTLHLFPPPRHPDSVRNNGSRL